MKIVMISGSNRSDSRNIALLSELPQRFRKHKFELFDISELPLFVDQGGDMKYPQVVIKWAPIDRIGRSGVDMYA